MAEHKVSGGTMLLFIDPNGGTTYDTVVCLKSVGVSDSINPIDTSSWCGSGKLPGLLNISYSFDGFHIQDVDTGRISGTDLRVLLRNKTRIGWKIAPESPQIGDEIQSGIGFISSLSSNYSFDNVGDFSMTVEVKGNVTTEISSYYLGQIYGGGIIVYIEENGHHGLIAPVDEVEPGLYQLHMDGSSWGNDTLYLGGTSPDYGQGDYNTTYIIENDVTAYAANYCQSLNFNGYTDWFLPSQDEWQAILPNVSYLGSLGYFNGFPPSVYWTSTESQTDTSGLFAVVAFLAALPYSTFDDYKFLTNFALPIRYF